MANETKKRLLLSIWRGKLETLRHNAKQHKKDLAELQDELELTKSHHNDAENDLELAREAHLDEIALMETALLEAKYWLHDGIVLHKLVSDPRALLRKIEDVL